MDGNVKAPAKSKGDDAILEEARERFKLAKDADAENRTAALDDIQFAWNLNDAQWPDSAKKSRAGRPRLTENRLPQFIRQVVNAQRMNRPSITVAPVDSQGDPEVAEVYEGMIRHIEQVSKADLAYDSSFEAAVTGGIGYFRVTTRYVPGEGGNQELAILPIDNAFSVYDDPYYQLPDASDRSWCFVTEWVDRKEFPARYGSDPSPWEEGGTGDQDQDWADEKRVQVAEYWRTNGDAIEQFVLTCDRILSRSQWAGTKLPIIPVLGEVKNIEGKRWRKSLIRDTKDLCRVNNYYLSAEVEAVALQPRTPFIGPTGAFETDAAKWATANVANHAYIQYDPVEGAMQPQRTEPPTFPAAFRETRLGAIEGIKAVMGIYDASLGARSNETSGVAIEARAQQGDLATYHYLDNMTRAIRYAGEVLIELIPKIYDAPRVVRIIAPDGEAAMVAVNQVFVDPRTMQDRNLNLASGRYDVVVKAGPSYQTQRQEASTKIAELVKGYPPLAQIAGDLLFRNLDIPDADKIADRMKPQNELPPQVQQQMQQMQQMMEQGKQYIADLEAKLQKAEMTSAGKDLDKKKVELELQAKKAQDELMSGDTTGEELLRLRTDNATLKIQNQMAKLEKMALELGMRETRISESEQQMGLGPAEPIQAPDVSIDDGPDEKTMLRMIAEMMQQMQAHMVAPRKIVRGPDGKAAGVDIGGMMRVIERDAEGRAVGLH
jgi:hypothetical protein